MSEETIVVVYDSVEQAEAAVRDLLAAGIAESTISRHDRAAVGMAPAPIPDSPDAEPPRQEGFWSRLFGGDRDYDHVYDRSIEAGSTVIAVLVQEEDVSRISEILDRHNPVDIDERASAYARETQAEAPDGYEETRFDSPVARYAEVPKPRP